MMLMEEETMTDEDQERYETYLELEEYIETLQAGRAAHPPAHVTAEQMQIYRMAAFFCSASPCAAEPSAEFADTLYARLLTMVKEANDDRPRNASGAACPCTMRKRKVPRFTHKCPGSSRLWSKNKGG